MTSLAAIKTVLFSQGLLIDFSLTEEGDMFYSTGTGEILQILSWNGAVPHLGL